MIIEPKVTVWATTTISDELVEFIGVSDKEYEEASSLLEADYLAAAAGKICYTPSPTWNNEKTNTVEKYIKNILNLQHYSVLAHASVTFYIEGVSRALTHELIRSRFLGFSQLSQRYCDSAEMDWVCPPIALGDKDAQEVFERQFTGSIVAYDELTTHFMEKHTDEYTPHMLKKRAREAARGVLPNICETKLAVSGNIRAWRDFLLQRVADDADLEIMRLGHVILDALDDIAKHSVSDIRGKV
jgi:thymidylate synthase (FAD)